MSALAELSLVAAVVLTRLDAANPTINATLWLDRETAEASALELDDV